MEKNSKTNIVGDLIYSIGAIALMNIAAQLFVYPRLNNTLGAEGFGDVLYLLGIIGIFSGSFGLAANNTRLVIRNKHQVTNGDFALTMVVFSLAGILGSYFLVKPHIATPGGYIAFFALLTVNTYRYYCDVQFRLIINYKKYFIYYLLLSIGYCVGALAGSLISRNWCLVFLLGEAAAVMYVILDGNILTKQLRTSKFAFKALKSSAVLSLSYLMFNTILFIDRIILLNLVDSQAVSQYYVASLLGKTLAIITGPLNTIILSYLTRDKRVIDKKQFLKIIAVVTLISTVFFVACWIATPVFVKIFYPNLLESANQLAAAASLAQVLCFSSTIFLAVVLTFASEKYQFIVQLVFSIVFIGFAIPLTKAQGVFGFARAAVIANIFRFLLVCVLGYINSPNIGKINQTKAQ